MALLNDIKLEIKDISKSYRDIKVLDKINFNVYNGEFLAILGSSGCGKTTLLRILVGLLEPTTGRILKDGNDITNLHPSKRSMGLVFQNYALFENMTVLENIEYAMKIKPEFKGKSREIAINLIRQVGLEEHINKKPYSLSGGQQQRVAIARTLALSPEIILLDEPMSALDVDTRLSLRKELKDIQKEFGTTMIYITHDQEEAFAMADRIMVMKEGIIEQIDVPESIIESPGSEYIQTFIIDNLKSKIESIARYIRI